MESTPLKRQTVLAIFGTYLGTKLLNSLTGCCSQPNILLSYTAACAGFDSFGNPIYNLAGSIAYNISIPGYTALTYIFSTQPFPNAATTVILPPSVPPKPSDTGTFIVGAVTAGAAVFFENLIVGNTTPGNYYIMVTDNRGNYSVPVTVIFPNCSKSTISVPTPP